MEELLGRAGREHRTLGFKARMARLFERWFDFYARHSMYVNPWEGLAFLGYYKEFDEQLGHISSPPSRFVGDQRFIEAIASALKEMVHSEDLVIVGRGGCMLLKDHPNTLHVGLAASVPTRVIRNMRKHNFSAEEAARFTRETDEARKRYYRKFFAANPEDPSLYALSLNTEALRSELATELIVSRASLMGEGRQN